MEDVDAQAGEKPAGESRQLLKAMALVFVLALAPRAALYLEARETPMMPSRINQLTDMSQYDAWARKIAAGDWLTQDPPHPLILGDDIISKRYFAAKPAELERLRAKSEKTGLPPSKLLWEEWLGGAKRMHWEPLYPYMMGAIYAVAGVDQRNVFIFQIILSAATCALIYYIAWALAGPVAGGFAAALAALDGTLFWSDIHLLRTTLTIFLAVLLPASWVAVTRRPSTGRWLIAGIVSGAGFLAQSYFLVASLLFLGWYAVKEWRLGQRPVAAVVLFLAGLAISYLPVAARNLAVGLHPANLMTSRSYFFVIANAPDLEPFQPFNLHTPWVGEIMAQTGGKPLPLVLATIRAHGGYIDYAVFLLGKLAAMLVPFPPNDNGMEYSYFHLHSAALKLAPVNFGLVLPLAIMGMVLLARRREAYPLFIMAAAMAPLNILFFTMARYRIPLEAVLIPLAGVALARFVEVYGRRTAGAVIGGGLLLAVFAIRPPEPNQYAFQFPVSLFFQPLIQNAIAEKDYSKAAGIFGEMFENEKDFGIQQGSIRPDQAATARWLAGFLLNQANLYRQAGNQAAANQSLAKAHAIEAEVAALGAARPR